MSLINPYLYLDSTHRYPVLNRKGISCNTQNIPLFVSQEAEIDDSCDHFLTFGYSPEVVYNSNVLPILFSGQISPCQNIFFLKSVIVTDLFVSEEVNSNLFKADFVLKKEFENEIIDILLCSDMHEICKKLHDYCNSLALNDLCDFRLPIGRPCDFSAV